jgi:ribosomal 50S subunit-recycling heat shock protein
MERSGLKISAVKIAMVALATLCFLPAVEATRAGAQELGGKLTLTGRVSVDGKGVQTGATVQNGSIVETGPDGDVMIDLNSLGSLHLRPNTSVKLVLSQNNCQVLVEKCGIITQTLPSGVEGLVKLKDRMQAQVAVTEGGVWIDRENKKKKDGEEKLSQKARSDKTYSDVKQVGSPGASSYTVECCQCCFVEKVLPKN